MTSPDFPEAPSARPATPLPEADAAVERVCAAKRRWLQTGLAERIALLRECLSGVEEVAPAWVRAMCAVKGLSPEENLAGEEWLVGPATTARNLRLLIQALQSEGRPEPASVTQRAGGQFVARVLPTDTTEKLLFSGFTADVWITPGKPPSQGRVYREPPEGPGTVCLVLGAGNVSSIPPMDVLYKLFVENQVVVLKMNPVNAVVGPYLERAFNALLERGFLVILYGGAEVGGHLANHPQVDTLHVTGSDRTYDAIVWGADEHEQKRRKAQGQPVNARPFTAELGCVSPVLVVPGDWDEASLDFQARQVASMVTQNASFNCNAAKVLVTARGWSLRERFVDRVRQALAAAPPRKAYYPGAIDRYRGFLARYPNATPLGQALGAQPEPEVVPWTVIPDVAPLPGEYALTREAFCGVLAEVSLDATTAEGFLETAVPFANNCCWGTLSCSILIDEAAQRAHARSLARAVQELRYGGIAINAFAGVLYATVAPSWGAFPGHPPAEIQSGSGVVHNTLLFDYPEKSVLRAPFRIRPTPPWFHDHKNLLGVGKALLRAEASPGLPSLLRLAAAGLRG